MADIMEKQKLITRKSFFRIGTTLIFGLVVWIWHRLSVVQTERENRLEFRHGKDFPLGISYFEKYYIFRNDRSVRAFLTKCTHAGCRIGTNTGTILQCNCHGSQFDAETGNPLKGPAIKPLQEIECLFDTKTMQWVVRMKIKGIKTT
jgi:Rieske Fe-S protein